MLIVDGKTEMPLKTLAADDLVVNNSWFGPKPPTAPDVRLEVVSYTLDTYVDFTTLVLGEHTAQVRFVLQEAATTDQVGEPIRVELWTDKWLFTMVPPKR